ncbi:MAG: UPF0182 family protein [Spirochaetia bacterium]|nr:UPF0182 family protein [Spirochaetia bacterium]
MNKKILYSIGAIVFVIYYIFASFNHVITEFFWFQSLHFEKVYWRIFNVKMLISSAVFILYFGSIYLNLKIALSATKNKAFQIRLNQITSIDFNKIVNIGAILISAFFAFVAASPASGLWDELLKYQNSTAFNIKDPVFQKDLAFYFFKLPLITYLKNILISLVILSLTASGVVYFFKGAIQLVKGWYHNFNRNLKIHVGALLAILFLLFSLHFWLLRYNILYSNNGISTGAGYTDTHTRLFGYNLMSFLFLLSVPLVIYTVFSNRVRPFLIGMTTIGASVVVFLVFIPFFQQNFIVAPYELEKEKPYIINRIDFTRKAYGLDHVTKAEYPLDNTLTEKDLSNYRSTFENIRLWDWRPLLNTYRQLQELRRYYTFDDVDVDRYYIDGNYRQVMLSVRELAYDQMPDNGKTWVNQRLRYTHGYGLVASPVDRVTKEGLPELIIKNIPPVSVPDLAVDRPGIYYGERTDDYIFTGTSMDEFDYPLGEDNKDTRYSGTGGVKINSFWKRILYAIENKSIKILISKYFTNETKILYNRNIKEIVSKIAPFLKYDHDPYIIIVSGKLKWIIDAYTVSDQYPYAHPAAQGVNYIRNSVKVVIDAYDGETDFYVIDSEDPVIQTYAKIFPQLFKNATDVPEDVRKHFRYPIDLFTLQSKIFLSYHMTQPEIFYNQEDLWRFPNEIYEGQEQSLDPYYTIMQLNGKSEESLLILPFTTSNKNNMIAWLAAGSDGNNYGKLSLYEFPKKELVYGPMQIEARIDQTPEISEVLTLWNQQGSSVIRGNMLVIPINHTLLYVEPLYLQAEKSRMPELKRVIVSYQNQIVMKETLEESLRAVFNVSGMSRNLTDSADKDISSLATQAVDEFRNGEKALQSGDWAEYGRRQKALSTILHQIERRSKK